MSARGTHRDRWRAIGEAGRVFDVDGAVEGKGQVVLAPFAVAAMVACGSSSDPAQSPARGAAGAAGSPAPGGVAGASGAGSVGGSASVGAPSRTAGGGSSASCWLRRDRTLSGRELGQQRRLCWQCRQHSTGGSGGNAVAGAGDSGGSASLKDVASALDGLRVEAPCASTGRRERARDRELRKEHDRRHPGSMNYGQFVQLNLTSVEPR